MLSGEFTEVVDFAIDDEVSVLGLHGLPTGRTSVQNTESCMGESDSSIDKVPAVIGATMVHSVCHGVQNGFPCRAMRGLEVACYSTHMAILPVRFVCVPIGVQ